MSGTRVLLGATFVSLDRLEQLGPVSARLADPENESEGKTRRYFAVTLFGERALVRVKQTSKVADFLEDYRHHGQTRLSIATGTRNVPPTRPCTPDED